MDHPRSSGILLHPTSLSGPWGIGDLGPEAYRFVEFLAAAGQTWWQMLPLGPTGYGNSPYMCFSAFAGNPWLINPEGLVEDGFLKPSELPTPPPFPSSRVDYKHVIDWKQHLLMKSFEHVKISPPAGHREGFRMFREKNIAWLEDYALFMALKEKHRGLPWTQWETDFTRRRAETLQEESRRMKDRIDFYEYVQYLFSRQWKALRRYCHDKGIRLIGDLPIYIAHDSADVWANPGMFYLNEQGNPTVVAGVPPDYFSATGQRWGNPIYRWDLRARDGYRWWGDRFKANLELVDLLRLDHFRGFEAYWEIPASDPHATNGRWVRGPGAEFFAAMKQGLGDLPVIAEDLGVITPQVEALRDEFGFPGMRILQMAFGDDPKAADYRPHNHVRHCVVYTATHDHNTTVGWFNAEPGKETTQTKEEVERERAYVRRYLDTDGHDIHWELIRLALSSVARLAIFPLQDVLGLGTEYRMNRPGTSEGNWEWRYLASQVNDEVGERLRELTSLYDRLPARGHMPYHV